MIWVKTQTALIGWIDPDRPHWINFTLNRGYNGIPTDSEYYLDMEYTRLPEDEQKRRNDLAKIYRALVEAAKNYEKTIFEGEEK